MRRARVLFSALTTLCMVCSAQNSDAPDKKPVTYATTRDSVQNAVMDLAEQVGLDYDWDKSFAQTDPECRRWVNNVSITKQPFDKALASILDPVNLRYEIQDGRVVLFRKPVDTIGQKPVAYSTDNRAFSTS